MTVEELLTPIDQSKLKVVYLPKSKDSADLKSYKLLNIPHARDKSKVVTYLYSADSEDDGLYELNTLKFGNNPFISKNKQLRETKDGEPIRSLLLSRPTHDGSSSSTQEDGLILSKPIIEIATKFNLVYLFLSHFVVFLKKLDDDIDADEDEDDCMRRNGIRYSTLDDLVESFENDSSSLLYNLVVEFPETSNFTERFQIAQTLELICDKLDENDEIFYRISRPKTISYLKSKVDKLVSNFPSSIVTHLILDKLSKPITDKIESISREIKADLDIPEEVMQLAKVEYSIHLLGSYLDQYYIDTLIKQYDFTKLSAYLKELQLAVERQKVAQDNLDALSHNLQSGGGGATGNSNNKKRKQEVTKGKQTKLKKPVVAVGKGALDSFFKKKV